MASTYNYTSLNPAKREIRILTVEPGEFSDPLECRLTVASLEDPPEYYALSYTWGNARIRRPVSINGKKIMVTPNLDVTLRYSREENQEVVLWADAICINQDDVTEKNHQVR
jgi:hypothetical protein